LIHLEIPLVTIFKDPAHVQQVREGIAGPMGKDVRML
jgi:hypothetical protein